MKQQVSLFGFDAPTHEAPSPAHAPTAAPAAAQNTAPAAPESGVPSACAPKACTPEACAPEADMAVYLSAASAQALQDELSRSLPPETPIFCAHMVGWPEEQLHWTTLGELAQCVARHNLTRQTVFLVLPAQNEEGAPSRLYAADFSHGCRTAAS